MLPRPLAALSLALSLAPFPTLQAQSVRLGAPLVQKLGDDTRSPFPVDLDSDGRLDLVVINNGKARIELLYQRSQDELREAARTRIERDFWDPIIDTAPFLAENLLVGDRLFALAALDFDSDGIPDLAFTGKRTPLTLRFGDGEGGWDKGWTFDGSPANPSPDSLAVADLNGDGAPDLAVLGTTELFVFIANKSRGPTRPDIYRIGGQGARDLKIADLDGDSLPDIAYLVPSAEKSIIVRLGLPGGGFGAELAIPRKSGAENWALVPGPPADPGAPPAPPRIVTVRPTLSEIDFGPLRLEDKPVASATALQAQIYPVPRSGSSAALPAIGDFDGDSVADVAMADPDGARILIWFGGKDGRFQRPVEFPALSGATSLSRLRNGPGKRDSLLMCSESEGFVGISTLEDNGRLPFPQPLTVEGDPLLAAGADLDADGTDEIVVAVKNGLRLEAAILKKDPATSAWSALRAARLGSIKRNPSHIIATDLDGAPGDDIIVFVPREPAHILVADAEGSLANAAENSPIRNGQFSDITPAAFATGDFDGDGTTDILLAKQGFVRAFNIRSGSLSVVDQGNARQGGDRISGPALVPPDPASGTPAQLVFYDPANETLQLLQKDQDGAFRYLRSLAVGPIDLTRTLHAPAASPGGTPRLLVFGTDRFWVLPLGGNAWIAESENVFRTNIEDLGFDLLATGDLNGDQLPEIIAIDADQNVIEILTPHPDNGSYKSALHFKVFEQSPFSQAGGGGTREPHAALVGDFDGTPGGDLLLLCHDRLLLYPSLNQ